MSSKKKIEKATEEVELPMGLNMALAKNTGAMVRFAAMSNADKRQIIEHTHEIRSKKEMEQYVNTLADPGLGGGPI